MSVTHIDDRITRVDALEKARGEAKYLADLKFENMLYSRLIRSTIARGKIRNIRVPSLPEGYYFISAKDIPEGNKNALKMIADDWRCFADGDVKYVGETIGILVGSDRGVLNKLFGEFSVEYEEETPVPRDSRIITSDDVFDFMLNLRNINEGIDAKREDMFDEYQNLKHQKFKMQSLADYEKLKAINSARRQTQSKNMSARICRTICGNIPMVRVRFCISGKK